MGNIYTFPFLPIVNWGDIQGLVSNQDDLLQWLVDVFLSNTPFINELPEITVLADNDIFIVETSADSFRRKKIRKSNMPSGGGGEANTASNYGTTGIGLYNDKNGVDLRFKNLKTGSSKVAVTDSPGDHCVSIDVNDWLPNVTNHSQLKRADGDINSFTEKAAPVDNDLVIIEDSEASYAKKKVKLSNLPGGGGSTPDYTRIWSNLSGTYASANTFTYVCADNASSDSFAKRYIGCLFTCTDSAGTVRRCGYVQSSSRITTTMTVTVSTNLDLASGDKDFMVCPSRPIELYKYDINIPIEIIADVTAYQGRFILDLKYNSILLNVDFAVLTAASGSGAALGINLYTNSTALFSVDQNLGTNTVLRNCRPTTFALPATNNITARVNTSAGATNFAADLQIRTFIVPEHVFFAVQ